LRYLLRLALVSCLAAPTASAQVVITEIMYHAESEDAGDDFIEIYNPGPGAVDLSGWRFDGVNLIFEMGDSIAEDSYLVVALAGGRFEQTYDFPPFREYTDSGLNDNGERLVLLDDLFAIVDEVEFDDGPPWPVTPDGLGPSLELIDPGQGNNDPRNWHASIAPAGHTAGAQNSVFDTVLPPWIEDVQATADPQPDLDPIVITATVTPDVTSVELAYVIGAERPPTEITRTMYDDGASNDGQADDDVWGLRTEDAIPAQPAGTPVRWRITATGPSGTIGWPRDDDTVLYDGTAVLDPAVASALPIFHWWMDPVDFDNATCATPDPCHMLTDDTEPALLFFGGKLYEAEMRVRGASSRFWMKKSWKWSFPQGHNFTAPGLIEQEVDTFNLESSYSDKTFMRELLAWETLRDGGAPSLQIFPVRLHKDGQFYGLYGYLEAPETDWLRRMGLDTAGSHYKAKSDMKKAELEELPLLYEKKNPQDDDFSDLHALLLGIDAGLDQDAIDFVFDNFDIPAMINYLALKTIMHDNDHMRKNYFLYRDTTGTGRWFMHAWDLDLTFGKNFNGETVFGDELWADEDHIAGYPSHVSPSHPLFGTSDHRKIDSLWNRGINRLQAIEPIRVMYFRRLRTLMDELLAGDRYETRMAELLPLIEAEAAADVLQSWGQTGEAQTLTEAVATLTDDYLAPRRVHLFETHAVCDCEIPEQQNPSLPILITEILFAPGDPEAEFVELYNASPTESADISGWRLDGVALTFPPGSVILPQSYAVAVKNDPVFRATYDSGLFLPAQYKGALNDFGEPLVLLDRTGEVISSVLFDDEAPWPDVGAGESLELFVLG
jgi:hypothetical protein